MYAKLNVDVTCVGFQGVGGYAQYLADFRSVFAERDEVEAQRLERKGELADQVELACLTLEHNGHEKQCPGDGYAQGGG